MSERALGLSTTYNLLVDEARAALCCSKRWQTRAVPFYRLREGVQNFV